LFAGYEYLKQVPQAQLSAELLDITGRLHNTALQRVDRCAAAHGIVAHTCFLDPPVVDLALGIPVELRLRGTVEKWILRQALKGLLPACVLERPKSKFWQGAGVGELLAEHAERNISDNDFRQERQLPNGWSLNSKEELLCYRLFRERLGELGDLSWMGRTKGAPRL
jgi:asparagine synthase (glutamine-hydrolysing)